MSAFPYQRPRGRGVVFKGKGPGGGTRVCMVHSSICVNAFLFINFWGEYILGIAGFLLKFELIFSYIKLNIP